MEKEGGGGKEKKERREVKGRRKEKKKEEWKRVEVGRGGKKRVVDGEGGRGIRLDGHFLVGGQDIARGCLVADLRHGVLADTQAVNDDFAVLVGGKGLVVIFADDTEREALHLTVRGCLDDFE